MGEKRKILEEDIIRIVEGYAKSTITQTIKEYIERIGISRSHFNTCVKKYKMLFPKKAKRIEKGISTRSKRAKSKAISKAHKKKKEYITPAGLIGKRNWTKSMIDKLLKNVEYKEQVNAYYACAAPKKLYDLKIIKRIEKTEKFTQLKDKAEKRKASAKKAVETKISRTVEIADTFSITVERIDLEDLREYTLNEKQFWYDEHWDYDIDTYRDAYSADDETVKRWMVNFIRHNLSNYDEQLERLVRRTGKDEGYIHYKIKLAEKMKKVYPELKMEIDKYMLGIHEKE